MLSMAWPWIAFAVIVLLTFLLQTLHERKNKQRKMPPSPRGIPILGHLHLLGKNPHQDLSQLAQIYGSIMYLQFGFVPVIIVSSPHAAEKILKTHDHVFANRPTQAFSKYTGEELEVSSAKFGSYWRDMRKLITIELLSSPKIKSFQPMRKEELDLFVKSLKQAAKERIPIDLSAKVASLIVDMGCLMIFGKKYKDDEFSEKGFRAIINELQRFSALDNFGKYIPYIDKLNSLRGLDRRMKTIANVFDEFFEKIIAEHVESKEQGKTKDVVDTLLAIMESGRRDFQIERAHVKATMMDLLLASTDTSAASIEWLMSELIKQPRVMKKVQKELEQVVGMERMVQVEDLEKLEYLDLIVKESFRLHPVVPMLLPHESMEDCIIDGYHIPEKTLVMVNAWAIGRDPNVWDDPEKFFPERFIGSNIDLRGRDFQLIPFGSGRRGCPGTQLGLEVVRLLLAQLVHCFDWELPNNSTPEELDMIEEFSLVVTRANPLVAIPTYRLNEH